MADNAAQIARVRQRLAELREEEDRLRAEDDDIERRIQNEQVQGDEEHEEDEEQEEEEGEQQEDDEDKRFEFVQKRQAFQFEKFRTQGRFMTEGEIEAGKFLTIKIPKRGRYRGPGLLSGKWKGSRFNWDPDDIGTHTNSKEAKRARISLQRRLKAHNFHLERTLGWGGNGIASLYRFKRGPAGPVDYFVVKCNLDSQKSLRGLRREREMQTVYRNALHIVQTLDFTPAPGRSPAAFDPMIFLESLPRGSLHKVICSAQENEDPFPDRALWHMFRCLIKSCIAMEYPPSKDDKYLATDERGEIIQPLTKKVSERIPPDLQALYDQAVQDGTWKDMGNAPGGEGLVHFDIDPQNLLFGGFPTVVARDDPHYDFPVLKVGDFGNAFKVDDAFLASRHYMWTFREQAKPNFMAPEQFTAEWDWVANNPSEQVLVPEEDQKGDILPPPPIEIAGKYSWKTNLYQLALCMISAITFHLPSLPPFPGKMQITDPQDGTRKTVWSYGAYILGAKYKKVDPKLRHLVAWCLCEKPAHRPALGDLLQKVDVYLAAKRWGPENSNETMQRFMRRNVDLPPPPKKRTHWVDEPWDGGRAMPRY
ncbi:kinase-like domain-containing protein [Chaetomium tenue]|uniref:Kinase-like domain-containing protein n=1 Tax=Chaetomium tenue TaxID=1854479 RepID=A0ACB7NYT2_9PEZI|nr:kinase-like domain-containing protein [Chaetomium globosum]